MNDENFDNKPNAQVCHIFPIVTVRNEVAKVMFLQASVCPQGGWVGVSVSVHGGIHPRGRHPPEQMPPATDTPPEQTPPPGSRHHPPGVDTPPEQTHPPEQTPPPPGADAPGADTPPPERRPLLRTVRILLECILVYNCVREHKYYFYILDTEICT